MYYYIYDAFVQHKEYAKDLAAIENRLADFGITGNIGRLSLFRDAGELVRDEVKRGAKTVVAVGDDSTVRKVIDAVIASRVTLAIIPMGNSQLFGRLFGIPSGVAAVEALAKRRVVSVDVGKINGRSFLSRVRVPAGDFRVKCEEKFELKSGVPCGLQVRNMGWVGVQDEEDDLGDPHDGMLDVIIDVPVGGRWLKKTSLARSTFPIRKMVVESAKPITAFIDEEKYAHARLEFSVVPKRLRVVVGRERKV